MYDPIEGHVDPYGVTHAYAKSAQIGGAEIVRHTRVTDLKPRSDGSWDVITDQGNVHAEHVVNAGGPVGARSRPHGRPRAADPRHGAPVPDHRRHAGTRRQEGAAARHRLRGRDLYSSGARRHADGHLRAGGRALVARHHALGFRPGSAAERSRAHRAEPRGRLRAFSGAGARPASGRW